MRVKRARRHEPDPDVGQRILLLEHAGAAWFAYNRGLARRSELYRQTGKATNAMEQHRGLNRLKKAEHPWPYEVSKGAPQEALRDLGRAWGNLFRGLQEGRKVGFPRFRKKGRDDRFRLTGAIRVRGRAVQLPRLGLIRLKEGPKVQGRVLSATVSREADRRYVSLTVAVDLPEPVRGPAVGIDVGLAHFATLVQEDGTVTKIPAPGAAPAAIAAAAAAQQEGRGSKNRQRSALRLARLHRRIRSSRQDLLHQLTTHLAKTKRVMAVEGLAVRGLGRNPQLARPRADMGWGEFRRMLAYEGPGYGSRPVEANRHFAGSRMCSGCGQVLEALPPDIREWGCPGCGARHDRDVNAARKPACACSGRI